MIQDFEASISSVGRGQIASDSRHYFKLRKIKGPEQIDR